MLRRIHDEQAAGADFSRTTIRGGKPCIKGTRIWVSLILDFLADGVTEAELLVEYPQLAQEDIRAAIAYGAEMARERVIPIALHKDA